MDSGSSITAKQFSGKHLLVVPYPGRGHVNPMINFSNLLSAKGFLITLAVTEEWLGFISSGGSSPAPAPNVTLRSIPNVIPSELNRGADFSGFLEAVYTKMETPLESLLDQLELPVSVIIADIDLPCMVAIGNRRNIPVAAVCTMAPTMLTIFYHFDTWAFNGHFPVDVSESGEDRLEYIPGISSIRIADLPSLSYTNDERKVLNRFLEAFSSLRNAQCLLFTSIYELETKVIDSLRVHLPFPVYTIGPSIPSLSLQALPSKSNGNAHMDYIGWLDSQPENSILYVALGSFLLVSDAQMDEIVAGLRLSGVRFLWVARAEASRLQATMFGDKGLVLPWCEQLRVLCHPSIGGFLTHCGWNSTLEGIYAGVPMLTFPIFWDQPTNSKLIVEDWQVGLRARSKVGSFVERGEIAEVVERFVDLNGEESKERRRRAIELKETCHRALENGGSSFIILDAFAKDFLARSDQ